MITLNKKYYLIVIIVFFIFAKSANAQVYINEVQISPTEGRFIELYNSGSTTAPLTGWYIQRKTSTGSEFSSLISKTHFEGKSIPAGGYFLISRNNMSGADIVYGSLTITESNSIQIKDSNQNVVSKVGFGDSTDCGGICAQNPTPGSSTQRDSGGSWFVSSPTPRTENVSNENASDLIIDTSTPISSSSTFNNSIPTTPTTKASENPRITTKIIANKIAIANVPFDIDHQTIGLQKEKIILGKFVWNFGDGFSKSSNTSEPFQYVYQYPGDYVLILNYLDSTFDTNPEATNRIVIKVIPSGINISAIGNISDPYIELENNSNYEIALTGWRVVAGARHFIIPDGMTILPNKTLKLSPRITGFDINDLSSISVLNSTGEVFATYPNIKPSPIKYSPNKNSYQVLSDSTPLDNAIVENYPNIINLNDLGASVAGSDSKNNFTTNTYAWLGLIGVIIVGIASVILIRRKPEEEIEYGDYVGDIPLRPKDMKIVE